MTTSSVEVERKFDVPADLALPDLSDLPHVHRVATDDVVLVATYFDTGELTLQAVGITLRRRTGGSDAGWHLKLPYGEAREEIHFAGDDQDVPRQLQALVRSRTRDRALVPVARLTTSRGFHRLVDEEERVLLEVADDVVVGRALTGESPEQRWREWEAELVEGPRSLLDLVQERLLSAGVRAAPSGSKARRVLSAGRSGHGRRTSPAGEAVPEANVVQPGVAEFDVGGTDVPAGVVVQAHLAEQVEELISRDPQVRRDKPDAVHKMRVATRRIRSALRTFRPLLDREVTDPLGAELKWLAEVLGQVRDTEVMHARLRRLVTGQDAPPDQGRALARIDAVLGERYRRAHDAVLAELDGPRYLRLLAALDSHASDPPLVGRAHEPASDVLLGLVRKADKRLDKAMTAAEQAVGEHQDVLLHEARKDAKRARYAAEALAAWAGEPAVAYAKAIARLQEVLGEHQDGVVTREALRELADRAAEQGESPSPFLRLHDLEQSRAEAAAANWPDVHARAADRRLRRWLKQR